MQLTAETLEPAVISLTQIIQQTEQREDEQNNMVLGTVAKYLTNLAAYVNDSNITISSMVSVSTIVYIICRDQ